MLVSGEQMTEYLQKPIEHVDVSGQRGVGELVTSFSRASFQARNLSGCAGVYRQMLADDEAIVFLGVAGALVPGGMRKVVADLIRHHCVDVLVSTGANLFHDFFEAIGYHHYVGSASANDAELREAKVDRIYDTFASDDEFGLAEKRIAKIVGGLEPRLYSSREFLELLADELDDEESILCTARAQGVPIFCPALCDSAIGIALTHHYVEVDGGPRPIIDQIRDNFEILQIKRAAAATGCVYLGGGVPKNYIQQLTPMLDAFGVEGKGHKYFVQLTTGDPKDGGLSGCTPAEAESWGKMAAVGHAATAYVDATIGLPLMAAAVLEQNGQQAARAKRHFSWNRDRLEEMRIG
jgi:deoxyhypusine synthase